MIKKDELNDPNSCLNRAKEDELLFVLLGRDVCASKTIRYWIAERIKCGKNQPNDPQIVEALACANKMKYYDGPMPGKTASVENLTSHSGQGAKRKNDCRSCFNFGPKT